MSLSQHKVGAYVTNLTPWCNWYNRRVRGHPWPRDLIAMSTCPGGLGCLHEGPSTDGTVPAVGHSASCLLGGCDRWSLVRGTQIPTPFSRPAAWHVFCKRSRGWEHPKSKCCPRPGWSRLRAKSWSRGTPSDKPEGAQGRGLGYLFGTGG